MSSKNNVAVAPNQHFASPDACKSFEEGEINLIDLLVTLLKYKRMIIFLVILAGVTAVCVSLFLSNSYRSEAIIGLREEQKNSSPFGALAGIGGMVASQLGLGGGGSLEKLEVVLKSRALSARVIDEYKLMPVLFSVDWDAEKKGWISAPPPTPQDGLIIIRNSLSVRADVKKNTISVGYEHKDPETAKKMVDSYLTQLSSTLREEVLRDATENMRFFREQLEKTSDALLREKIYALLSKEIEKATFARAQKYYGFLVLDPPIAPDPDKKVKPKRSHIFILSVLGALLGSVLMVFFIEIVRKIKAEDPIRYQQVVDQLKGWKKSRDGWKNS